MCPPLRYLKQRAKGLFKSIYSPMSGSTLQLYRQIVRAAKAFPSIKRIKILNEIRSGFRDNKQLPAGPVLSEKLALATKGLQQLSQYSNLSKRGGGNWAVNMETEPMPRRPQEAQANSEVPC